MILNNSLKILHFSRTELSIDVDDLLTLDLDEPWGRKITPKHSQLSSQKSVNKCYPTFIGSSDFPLGCTKPGVTR